jgi:hypothetical protein
MIYIILTILHFIFDWILQPRHIANAKGPTELGIKAVTEHMVINIFPFSACVALVLHFYGYNHIVEIILFNFISHGFIDAFLPKGTTEVEKIDLTALDQILHLTILFSLLYLK